MPSVITYNGIILNSVLTKRFEQTPQYDASGTDVIGSKFSMAFEGICHAQGTPGSAPAWVGTNSSSSANFPSVQQAFNQICQALWQPRAKLTVSMGGTMLFVCNPADSKTQYDDIENGPKPRAVRLSHITANNTIGPTFHVTFEIDCVRPCCPSGIIRDVLSNRWNISEGFDEEYYTTRSITGEIRLSSSKLAADSYRYLVVPTLEKGFKRDSLHWNVHADGLAIDYVVTDKQIVHSAPWPAAKMNVRHSEGTSTGAAFESECHVSLHGYPGADKQALFALAIRILENRLGRIKDMPGDSAKVPVAFSMVDTIGDRNEMEVYLKIQHSVPQKNGKNNYLGTPIGQIGTPLDNFDESNGYPRVRAQQTPGAQSKDYDSDISPVANPWGYNVYDGKERKTGITRLVMQCFCQTPCDDNHWIYQGGKEGSPNTSTPQKPPGKNDDVAVYQNSSLSPYQAGSVESQQSEAGQAAMFTHAAGETTLTIHPLRCQLPIASDPSQWNGRDDTSVFVTLGLPQATLTFHVECERVGEWPAVPEPVASFDDSTTGLKGSLLSAVLSPMPPTTDACAMKPIYHISARITYGLNRPPQRTEKIPIGILQWTNYTPDKTAVELSALYDKSVQPFNSSPGAANGAKY